MHLIRAMTFSGKAIMKKDKIALSKGAFLGRANIDGLISLL